MASNESFDEVLDQLQSGDQDAAREIWDRFNDRLLALARIRMDRLTRQKVDAEDVVQSAYNTFFKRLRGGQFELTNWDSLRGLLVRITLRKCRKQMRHFRSSGRDLRREVSLQPATDDSNLEHAVAGDEGNPSEELVLKELLDQVLTGMADRDQTIICLSLQGCSNAEIAEQLTCTERTVQRILRRVKKRLESRETE